MSDKVIWFNYLPVSLEFTYTYVQFSRHSKGLMGRPRPGLFAVMSFVCVAYLVREFLAQDWVSTVYNSRRIICKKMNYFV